MIHNGGVLQGEQNKACLIHAFRLEAIRSDTPSRDDDFSPPRRHHRQQSHTPSPEPDEDLSPPCRKSIEDLSPTRRNRNQLPTTDGDLSPPRSKGSIGDLSPPRRNKNQFPTTDDGYLSPSRSRGSRDDLSPPRRKRNRSVEIDILPPRRRTETSLMKNEDLSLQGEKHQPSSKGRKTGLLTAAEVKKGIDEKRKDEMSRFASMDASVSGKGAEAVFRDRDGKRIKKEDLLKAQMEEKPKEKKLEWGKGLAQKREAEARLKELELEKDKPFARSRDDPVLDKMLKERVRFGDPMAHLIKRKNTETLLENLGDDEKMKESGFIVPQTIPSHSWIKRGINYPPNRYNIRPGRHWDGVDRSNGSYSCYLYPTI